jgi:hypothetical protein
MCNSYIREIEFVKFVTDYLIMIMRHTFIYRAAEFREQKLVDLRAEVEDIERNWLVKSTLKIAESGFLKVCKGAPEIFTVSEVQQLQYCQ